MILLEFPSNLGLIEPSPGHEPGVRRLPDWLRTHGFHDAVQPSEVHRLNPPVYTMDIDPESAMRNADAIAEYASRQAELIARMLVKNEPILVLGGDCSILIGAALGLKQKGRYALFYLDGHHDFMWPALSNTAGVAGMDLALVTGYGHEKLSNISGMKPYFRDEDVYCVGNREYDQEYVKAIQSSAINYIPLDKLEEQGADSVTGNFLAMVGQTAIDGFWIHLDVDVLNPELMPAVDSPDPGGIDYKMLKDILRPLIKNSKFTGIEITILDPDLDPKGTCTGVFIKEILEILVN